MRAARNEKKAAGLLGLGLDNHDGHTRITRGKNFLLLGGSEETHALMQETAVKVNEHLDKRRQRLEDVPVAELRNICRDVNDSVANS